MLLTLCTGRGEPFFSCYMSLFQSIVIDKVFLNPTCRLLVWTKNLCCNENKMKKNILDWAQTVCSPHRIHFSASWGLGWGVRWLCPAPSSNALCGLHQTGTKIRTLPGCAGHWVSRCWRSYPAKRKMINTVQKPVSNCISPLRHETLSKHGTRWLKCCTGFWRIHVMVVCSLQFLFLTCLWGCGK